MKTLQDILNQRSLSALFQPIMDMTDGTILGYEGLIRGPADSPLHSPVNLFGAAKQQGLTLEVEMLCRHVVLKSFVTQNLPGNLFLNISPDTLTHPSFQNGQTLTYLEQLGIDPKRVIIEITENQPIFDFDKMRNALLHYRSMGFQIALDDLGQGFSSLRLWSELHPEFVKIDMHFVQGVNADPLKQQFLKSIQQIAQSSGTRVIAEGIETDAEFRVIRNIGISCGQGYFIGRPAPVPPVTLPIEVGCLINAAYAADQPYSSSRGVAVETLLRYVAPVQPETDNEKILCLFSLDKNLRAIPVVKHGRPVGLINRNQFLESFSQPFQRELLGRKPCTGLMNHAPLLVEKSTPIHELSGFLSESDIQHFTDGFIITEQGRYIGLGTGQDLLRAITQAQIETARYANPLTLLPGNVPINEQIDHLLQSGKPFVVGYGDLDHFKPFNDVYGYRKGDEVIQFTGRVLSKICDSRQDFIGHIGGDDFILVMQSEDWELRCNRALADFAQTSNALFDKKHRAAGGYMTEDRQGNVIHQPLPTLSIGAIQVAPGQFHSHHEVSEAASIAKKMAKKIPGNSLFIEQRQLNPAKCEAEIVTFAMHDFSPHLLTSLFRGLRLALHILYGTMLAVFYPKLSPARQRRALRIWSKRVLSILNIALHIEGEQTTRDESGCLFIANHISWLDIFVMNAVHPARFVAKAEVRNWPLIGWLCQRTGTIFIERALRKNAAATNLHISSLLTQGICVGLFPEGTTTDGRQVGHFHSALIQPAIDAGARLCPIALRYQHLSGKASTLAAFTGEMTLLRSIWQILRGAQLNVVVAFTPTVSTLSANRRVLASTMQQSIAQRLLQPVAAQNFTDRPSAIPHARLSAQSAYVLLLDPILNHLHK